MAAWAGQNWQVLDGDGSVAIGVTLGIGLLDEPAENTGALAIALAALRAELARPVELAAGGASLPEAAAEVSTDTSTLVVRGSRDAVAAAWARLPELFTPGIVSDDLLPLRSSPPLWAADLVRRTGRNAASLSALQGVAAPNAHELARLLVPRLNPGHGEIRTVFFTTDESLVGTAFPVREAQPGPARKTGWADATPAGNAGAGMAGTVPAKPGSGPDLPGRPAPTSALASLLVPRSVAGLAAGQVLQRQLAATAAQTIEGPTRIYADTAGMGPGYCIFLAGSPLPEGDARRRLLETFATTLTLVPDTWLDEAIAQVAASPLDVLERERRILGLGTEQGISRAEVLQAVLQAADTLHLAAAPLPVTAASIAGSPPPAEDAMKRPRKDCGRRRTFKTWTDGRPGPTPATTANRLAFDDGAILAGVKPSSLPAIPVSWLAGVDSTRALAVLEDQAGTITLLDDQFRSVSFNPLLFRRSGALRRLLDERLDGVPRLSHATTLERAELERWARRSKTTAISLSAVAMGFGAFILVMAVLQNSPAPAANARLTVTETAELNNGTTVTASAFDIVPPNPDDPEYTVTVKVNFCAGKDTKADNLPPESQRSVSPADFSMFDDQYSQARLVDSAQQLRQSTLQRGQCAGGDLVFKGQRLDNPRLSYHNAAGDDVVWYRYGQVPKQ